jgi:alcohol dehydrogenase
VRALVFTRPNTVEVMDVEGPQPVEGEVMVRVAAAGICGSELHGIYSGSLRTPPLIMGHEFSGHTEDGQRVTVNPLLSCGACDMCSSGNDHLCRNRMIIGIDRPGAFAESLTVPVRALHVLDDSMTFEVAAMIEPLANAVHALRLAQPKAGDRIGVIGAGTIGLMSLLMALQTSSNVEVSELVDHRLQIALDLGAIHVGESLSGEFDIVIDAVGGEETHRHSINLLRPGGVAVWLGLLSSNPGFDGQEIVRAEKRVLGSYCYTSEDFTNALRLAPNLPLDWSESYPLREGADVFYQLMEGRLNVTKALLVP